MPAVELRSRGASALLLGCAVLTAGCLRGLREEKREAPVEAGVAVTFASDAELRWVFGDDSPPQQGRDVRHAFARAGRYVVQGFRGDEVRERVFVSVIPRPVFHSVPADADLVVAFRGLEDLAPAVDFGERLTGPGSTQQTLDESPLFAFAVEQAGSSPLDAREGLAWFTWPDVDAQVALAGVLDDAAALDGFTRWLLERGWSSAGEAAGLRRFEVDQRALDVFVDRGVLFAVSTAVGKRVPSAQARVAAAPVEGLERDATVAHALDALASGGVVLLARGTRDVSWSLVTAAVKFSAGQLRLDGQAWAPGPLWTAPQVKGPRLLDHAPDGAVFAAAATMRADELFSVFWGAPGSPRRVRLTAEVRAQGVELDRALSGFRGAFDLGAWFDVVAFVRGTIARDGRPEPEGAVLFEAPVEAQADANLERLIGVLLSRAGLQVMSASDKDLRLWRGEYRGRPFELALTREALFAKLGAPPGNRETVDLAQSLARRFDGAFSAGHVSLFADVGQLRRELLTPHYIEGVDPRRAISAQALAVTLLDKLTQLDSVLFDAQPNEKGAALQAVITLREPEREAK